MLSTREKYVPNKNIVISSDFMGISGVGWQQKRFFFNQQKRFF